MALPASAKLSRAEVVLNDEKAFRSAAIRTNFRREVMNP
jgi:hypothetical protein